MCQIVEFIKQANAIPSVRGYIPVSKRKDIARQISKIEQENSGVIISEQDQIKIFEIISEMYSDKVDAFSYKNN